MARTGTKHVNTKKDAPTPICSPLAHPIRARILDVLSEEPMSPVRFHDEGLSPYKFTSRQHGLSDIAYHFRKLEEAECIELVERIPKRGATEHIYRSIQNAVLSDKEFERLPFERRKALSKSSFQAFIAKTDRAIQSGAFDSHADRTMVWTTGSVDQRGWEDIRDILSEAFYKAERAREEAELRVSEGGEDMESIPCTFALMGFESPPRDQRI